MYKCKTKGQKEMMTRNKENKGKMPRVTLDITLNPTKIDEFGS